MTCQQEMCPYWAGDGGCPCAMFGIEVPICPNCGGSAELCEGSDD